MTDQHTHCFHSHDSTISPETMVNEAILKGLKYIAFTDHSDKDYKYCDPSYPKIAPLDFNKHIEEISYLKDKYKDKIIVACGIECGYSKESEIEYINDCLSKDIDVVINSIHTIYGKDCYFPDYFAKTTMKEAYSKYLKCVRDSLDAKYFYNIVGHLGYVMRKAPYENGLLLLNDFKSEIDDILMTIIEKKVTLEVNSHCTCYGLSFLPTQEIIKEYKKLGGKRITFSSDAHAPVRIAQKYDLVTLFLKDVGFSHITNFINKEEILFKL